MYVVNSQKCRLTHTTPRTGAFITEKPPRLSRHSVAVVPAGGFVRLPMGKVVNSVGGFLLLPMGKIPGPAFGVYLLPMSKVPGLGFGVLLLPMVKMVSPAFGLLFFRSQLTKSLCDSRGRPPVPPARSGVSRATAPPPFSTGEGGAKHR